MAYTTPSTKTLGSLVRASDWNAHVENIRNLAEGPFHIRTSTGQQIGNNDWNRVEYDTHIDSSTRAGSLITYSTSTFRFSFEQTGRYQVVAALVHQSSTTSTGGTQRGISIARGVTATTSPDAGSPIAMILYGAPNSTLEDIGGTVAAEALITSTTMQISIRAFQDSGVSQFIYNHSTAGGEVNRVSLRWVGPA